MQSTTIGVRTQQGNGLGGGDYWGTNEELIGTWALDTISIEDEPIGKEIATEYFVEG